MLVDNNLKIAVAESPTTGQLSASWLDLTTVQRDIAEGQDLYLNCTATAAVTSATAGATLELRAIVLPDTVLARSGLVTTQTGSTITRTGHGLTTGTPVYLTSIVTTTGITANTTYFVIWVDANTFSLATTRANALAGTKVTFGTGNGTATLNYLPTTLGATGPIPAELYPANSQHIISLRPIVGSSPVNAAGTTSITNGINGADGPNMYRYLFVFYVPSATLTGGTFNIDFVTSVQDGRTFYPSGFQVT